MIRRLDTLTALAALPHDTIIDVRSPAEFAIDHLPGAINLPVLSDTERAEVGTIYKQQSPFMARKLGAARVAANAAAHLRGPLKDKPGGWQPLVYCWRGGQRSGSFASILQQIGWRVETLEGGYQSYRRLVVAAMHKTAVSHQLILIDGRTGTAKTQLLQRLENRGHQVLDLESFAAHRGSVFGATERDQPSQKMFEGQIASRLSQFDPTKPVLLEAEANKIGNRTIPPSLWARMRNAPGIMITAPIRARARFLVAAYDDITTDADRLTETLDRLVPLQGRARVEHWKSLAAETDFKTLAEDLMQSHYDPRYDKARMKSGRPVIAEILLQTLDDVGLSQGVVAIEAQLDRTRFDLQN